MRSLFFKIFACFWLSHLIVVSLLFAILTASQQSREAQREVERSSVQRRFPNETFGGSSSPISGALLARYARDTPMAVQRDGFQAFSNKIRRESGLQSALFDSSGQILASKAPREAAKLAKLAGQSGENEFAFSREGVLAARRVAANGDFLVLLLIRSHPRRNAMRAGTHERSTSGSLEGRGRGRGRRDGSIVSLLGFKMERRQAFEVARLAAIFLAAGIVAFGLARYLTGPTAKLRRATRQFAAGDLSTRVGPQMGRRRDELADLGRDFDQMAERIEALLLSQRRLLGDISHELGSPLARLNVALELAGQGADDKTREYLSRIERESGRLDALIGQLLTLARLESAHHGAKDDAKNIHLSRLVEDVCADADFEARQQGRSVRLSENQSCHLKGNADLLRSAIENVVRNAVRHAPQSSEIEVALQIVTREDFGRESSQMALLRVRDYGPGVPEEALAELFRPFYRVTEARDRQSGGVGLGLAITQRAVTFHGGSVHASNAPNGGLLVEIELPVEG
jgi:signal transduction histidine kinase